MLSADPILRIGACLMVLIIGLAGLSYAFPYEVDLTQAPLALYIGLALIAGGVWVILPSTIRQLGGQRTAVGTILVMGLVMRGAMMLSTPVLEDDSYRYLWDGAVVAQGIDPYKYAPAEASPESLFEHAASNPSEADLEKLQHLAAEHPTPFSRINYPYVATIYPPLTQAAFAIAHFIDPFGLTGWRLVLLLADLVTFGLLVKLLRAHQRDPVWSALYWWNPVVILQGFGAAHMDLLLLPFLLATLLLAKDKRPLLASLALAGAAAVKLWPILLFPLVARPLLKHPTKLVATALVFLTVIGALLLPQLVHAFRPEAGVNAYASDWRTHTFLFALSEDIVFAAAADPGQAARLAVAASISLLTLTLALRYAHVPSQLPALFGVVIAALLFLSPTGYPWYFIWIAPLLAFIPHRALLCLVGLAPLYWLRFQLGDDALIYQWGIVPIAFGLPLFLLLQPHLKGRRSHALYHHHSSAE